MVYLYRCESCFSEQELGYPMGHQPGDVPCNACQGRARRVFTAPTVRFVGLGWASKYRGISDAREAPPENQFDDLQ